MNTEPAVDWSQDAFLRYPAIAEAQYAAVVRQRARAMMCERAMQATVGIGHVSDAPVPGLPAPMTIPPMRAGEDPKYFSVIGSGVIMCRSGIVATAAHVLSDARKIGLTSLSMLTRGPVTEPTPPGLPSGSQPFTQIEFLPVLQSLCDDRHDLAAIATRPIPGLAYLPAVTTDPARPHKDPVGLGEEIGIVGYPHGFDLHADLYNGTALDPIIATGIIGSLQPSIEFSATHREVYTTDAVINPGNSGGPAFSFQHGMCIGIVISQNVATRVVRGAGDTVIGGVETAVGLGRIAPMVQFEPLWAELSARLKHGTEAKGV